VAVWQGRVDDYFRRAAELAFNVIEISDGTIPIEPSVRRDLIKKALDKGFKVVTEVGKKDARDALPIALTHQLIHDDLDAGALKVIIEAREAGKGVGIFDAEGRTRTEEMETIVAGVSDPDVLIWEAPLKNQQQDLILRFGTNVNLGNVPPEEILALEALRQGVRGDTLKKAYLKSPIQ
jgi:phosphosulfolactate synthase